MSLWQAPTPQNLSLTGTHGLPFVSSKHAITGASVGPVSTALSVGGCVVTVVADVVVAVIVVVVVAVVIVVLVVVETVDVVVLVVVVVEVVLVVELVDSLVRLRTVVVGFAVVLARVVVEHFRQRPQVKPQYFWVLLLLHCCGGLPRFWAGQLRWSSPRQHCSTFAFVVVETVVVDVSVAVVVVLALVLSGFFGGGPTAPPPQLQQASVASIPPTA